MTLTEKLNRLRGKPAGMLNEQRLNSLIEELKGTNSTKKFMVKTGNKVKVIDSKDVFYFYFDSRLTFLFAKDQKRYVIDSSLKQLELSLPEKEFFRANRNYLLRRDCIIELQYLSATRVKVIVESTNEQIILAREKLSSFKKWLLE